MPTKILYKPLSEMEIRELEVELASSRGPRPSRDCIKLSTFLKPGLAGMLGEVPRDHLILCVMHFWKHQFSDFTDVQVGHISGHPRDAENIEEGLKRELMEELSLAIFNPSTVDKYLFSTDISPVSGKKTNYYCIPLDDCYVDECHESNKGNKDASNMHYIMMVHGKEEEIINYMKNEKININNEDGISAILAMPRDFALDIINHITDFGAKNYTKVREKYYMLVNRRELL